MLKRQVEKRVILKAAPRYYVKTRVFGPVPEYMPGLFPRYEGAWSTALQWVLRASEQWKWYGLLDDGGLLTDFKPAGQDRRAGLGNAWTCRGKTGWYDQHPWPCLLAWVRTGDDDIFDFTERAINYLNDVLCIHAETEASLEKDTRGAPTLGGIRVRCETGDGTNVVPRGSNAYAQAFFYYLTTGDPRTLDVILEGLSYDLCARSMEPGQAGALLLGYELLSAMQSADPRFEARHNSRREHLLEVKARAEARRWRKSAAAAGAYLRGEIVLGTRPRVLFEKAKNALQGYLAAGQWDIALLEQLTESATLYELALSPASREHAFVRGFYTRAAEFALAKTIGSGKSLPVLARPVAMAYQARTRNE